MSDDLLQQFAMLHQKLESFMQLYERRHDDLERRVDKIEARVEAIETRINSLHEGSMGFVHKALSDLTERFATSLAESERRIFDQLESRSRFSISNWVLVGIAAIGWIIGIGTIAVTIFK